jgi:hypothetical protein
MGWHQPIDLTTKFGAPEIIGRPACYVYAQYTQNIIYVGWGLTVGPNGLIHQLRWENNAWHHKVLIHEAGAPPVFADQVRAYLHSATGTQHVVYLGRDTQGQSDNQVHELYAYGNNKWHHHNLTTAVAGGAPLARTTPTGYEFRNLQHVVYQGIDGHIYELWHDSNGWHVNDLTNAPVMADGPLTARVFADTQHITFRGTDAHIHELWWDSSGWHQADLTVASQAPINPFAGPSGALTNYVFAAQRTQHINYLGIDDHIHELWSDSSGWHHNDLTLRTRAQSGGRPSGYVFKDEGTQHVVYKGQDPLEDTHIHELWWDNSGWHHNDLTPAASLAQAAGGDPTGYEFTPNPGQSTQHVIYANRAHHILELKWTP